MVGSFQDSQCTQICPYKKNKIMPEVSHILVQVSYVSGKDITKAEKSATKPQASL